MIKNSIFIPIAACEERFIEHTIKSALFNAKNPGKVYFGVFNNILKKEHSLLDNEFIKNNPHIFYCEILTPCAMGTGFSRMNASLLQFQNFDYMFQIDSHTFFTKNWDEKIIYMYEKIKNENKINEDKLVLSGIPPINWTYDENNLNKFFISNEKVKYLEIDPYNLEKNLNDQIANGLIVPKIYYNGLQNHLIEKYINFPMIYNSNFLENEEYKEVNCVHASFVFSKANINREVLHDPEDFFDGDQTNYSIRLISRGYRIFCPKGPVVASLNKIQKNNNEVVLVDSKHNWRTHVNNFIGNSYQSTIAINGKNFFKSLISGQYFGYWGAPNKKSLNETKKKINYPNNLV